MQHLLHVGVRRILTSEALRSQSIWPPALLAEVDRIISTRSLAKPKGAATPKHLASSFVACGSCGGGLTATKGRSSSYVCARCNAHGREVCPGIGYRSEARVDEGLLRTVRSAITGRARDKALAIARELLAARPDVTSEREAVVSSLAEAEREGASLARAIAKTGKLDSLVDEAMANDLRKKDLRARLARLNASPTTSLDAHRRVAGFERRLDELCKALDAGGIAARPALAAVLQGRRLAAFPFTVNGERRWRLAGRIPAGFLTTIDGTLSSVSCPWCDGPPGWPWPSPPPPVSPPG